VANWSKPAPFLDGPVSPTLRLARIRSASTRLAKIKFAAIIVTALCAATTADAQTSKPLSISVLRDPQVDAAYERFYNMDYDRATQDFEKVLDKNPNDPTAVNHLLTSVLMHELYKMGAMNTGEYANDSFVGQAHRTADPKVKERIKQLVGHAESLEEHQLKSNSNNVDALYARGVTRAQFAVYTALVERAWF